MVGMFSGGVHVCVWGSFGKFWGILANRIEKCLDCGWRCLNTQVVSFQMWRQPELTLTLTSVSKLKFHKQSHINCDYYQRLQYFLRIAVNNKNIWRTVIRRMLPTPNWMLVIIRCFMFVASFPSHTTSSIKNITSQFIAHNRYWIFIWKRKTKHCFSKALMHN